GSRVPRAARQPLLLPPPSVREPGGATPRPPPLPVDDARHGDRRLAAWPVGDAARLVRRRPDAHALLAGADAARSLPAAVRLRDHEREGARDDGGEAPGRRGRR